MNTGQLIEIFGIIINDKEFIPFWHPEVLMVDKEEALYRNEYYTFVPMIYNFETKQVVNFVTIRNNILPEFRVGEQCYYKHNDNSIELVTVLAIEQIQSSCYIGKGTQLDYLPKLKGVPKHLLEGTIYKVYDYVPNYVLSNDLTTQDSLYKKYKKLWKGTK